jgi:hypothetical protein
MRPTQRREFRCPSPTGHIMVSRDNVGSSNSTDRISSLCRSTRLREVPLVKIFLENTLTLIWRVGRSGLLVILQVWVVLPKSGSVRFLHFLVKLQTELAVRFSALPKPELELLQTVPTGSVWVWTRFRPETSGFRPHKSSAHVYWCGVQRHEVVCQGVGCDVEELIHEHTYRLFHVVPCPYYSSSTSFLICIVHCPCHCSCSHCSSSLLVLHPRSRCFLFALFFSIHSLVIL